MFSHLVTGGFTPVCTTEFMAFATYYPYFVQRNVQLMVLSIDSVYSHLAWVYNIYIPEILRIIDSLQTVDSEKVVTPANWIPGSPVVVPPPQTYAQLKERVQNPHGYSCMDWYLCMKPDDREKKQIMRE